MCRFWIFGALLVILGVLALVEYHWIKQVADAERQRAKTSLATALSDLENDFDFEVTRVLVIFQAPTPDLRTYSERYKEWLRLAPYPNLLRGVYVVDPGSSSSPPQLVLPGEPAIEPGRWQQDLVKVTSPATEERALGPVTSQAALGISSEGAFVASAGVFKPEALIDGNPAFVFPIVPAFETSGAAPIRRFDPVFALQGGSAPVDRFGRTPGPHQRPQFGLVILDASYIKTTLLPRVVQFHFSRAASDYDILVVDETVGAPSRVVFHSESAPAESKFARPDGSIHLLGLRLSCFHLASPPRHESVAHTASGVRPLENTDELTELLTRRPSACSLPGLGSADGPWKMLVRYRAGSLDQAVASFRYRNMLFGGSVLLVLALGMLALIASTERARTLAHMQTEFVLGVSHELRTPLTVISLAADNLKKGMAENSEHGRKYGEIIGGHVSQLSNMVEQALAFARTQSPAFVPHTAPTSPEQIVKASLANCQRAVQDAGLEVELDIEPDLPLVDVDVSLMNRCLENLIHNAVKYAAAGRHVAVRVRKVCKAEGDRVQISVEDRGPGISSLDLPRIFEPFYRGRHAEVTRAGGVGLGLALVRRIMEAHCGTVDVQSSEVTGTSFSLFLPPHRAHDEGQRTV